MADRSWAGRSARAATCGLLLVLAACSSQLERGGPEDGGEATGGFLIVGATVHDGGGGRGLPVSVRVQDGLIAEIGSLEPAPGEQVIDAAGQVLAPGFIDSHSHHDWGLLEELGALAAISQGITTIVVGQDGGSQAPLADFFAQLELTPAAVNVASFSGHNTLRAEVMGDDFARPASASEVAEMAIRLEEDLDAGALGLSTGLEYDPGAHSETSEIIELARVAHAVGGRYISHMRSEDRALFEAVDELIEIGRSTGIAVQATHLKLAMRGIQGRASELIQTLDRARAEGIDVTADVYPYTYWQSTIRVLFPDRDFEDQAAARFAVEELAAPSDIIVSDFEARPEYAGRSLADIARERGEDPARTLLELIAIDDAARSGGDEPREAIIATSMAEDDIDTILSWPHASFCTDGGLRGAHPRGFGAFPRFFRRFVRERGVLTLEEAIRRATSQAAESLGLPDVGVIDVGRPADLVLFDAETIEDRATIESPHEVSVGVSKVWVSGDLVFDEGGVTSARPGRVIRRSTN